MDSFQSLPAYAGYAIGNLIRKEQVIFRTLNQERRMLFNQFKELKARKPLIEEGKEATIDQINWAYEMRMQQGQLNLVEEKISTFIKQNPRFVNIEESLPIDRDRVKIKDEPSSFASECFTHIVLERERRDSGDIKEFISNLLRVLISLRQFLRIPLILSNYR